MQQLERLGLARAARDLVRVEEIEEELKAGHDPDGLRETVAGPWIEAIIGAAVAAGTVLAVEIYRRGNSIVTRVSYGEPARRGFSISITDLMIEDLSPAQLAEEGRRQVERLNSKIEDRAVYRNWLRSQEETAALQ